MSAPAATVAGGRGGALAAVVRAHAWTIGLWSAMAAWSVALCVVVRGSYTGFREGRFDLGNMVQAVWSTTQGRFLEVTDGVNGEQMTRLGGHVDPFLALLAPVWALWPSPLALAFAQVAFVSLGALPVYWLGRLHLGSERAAGLLALGYLAYPWLGVSAVGAIHPVTFAVPLYLFCVWALETRRLGVFAVCALLAMSTGELMGLPVAGLGLWYAVARGRRPAGAAIALAGAAWSIVAVLVVVPAFRGEASAFYGFYDHVGGSPQGVLRTLVTDPGVVLGALFEAHDLVYLLWLGLPLCGLFVLAPGLALIAVPQLLANTLSDFRAMSDPRYHSIAAVFPFLMAATVLAIGRLSSPGQRRAAGVVLLVSVVLSAALGPWPRLGGGAPLGGRETLPSARVAALRDAVATVPDGVAVTASNVAGAHLSARRYIYTVPVLRRAQWVVVDRADTFVATPTSPILVRRPPVLRRFVERLEADPAWVKVFERGGVAVFRRGAP